MAVITVQGLIKMYVALSHS